MTALARFLFLIAALTFLGCSASEKPAADSAPSQDVQQEGEKEATVPPQATEVSTDTPPLISPSVLDLEKEVATDNLSPTEVAPPKSTQEGQAALPGMSAASELASDSAPEVGLALNAPAGQTPAGTETAVNAELKDQPPAENKSLPVYPEYAGLTPDKSPSPEAAPAEAASGGTALADIASPESVLPALNAPATSQPESMPAETPSQDQTPMVPFTNPQAEAAAPSAETASALPESPAVSQPLQSLPESHANPLREGEDAGAIRDTVGSSEDSGTVELTSKESPIAEMAALAGGGKTSTKGKPNSKGEPFDPIKENGPIFVGWPKPELVLLMTGRQNGYIEPCGCAGMDRMKGGLTRRDTMIKDLIQNRKWPVVALDVGNQVKGHKRQTELKFQHTAETFLEMGYDGVGLGIADLQLPAGELAAITSNENSPFISANIDLFEPGTDLIAKYRIVEENGIKVGITAVLGNSFRKQLNNKSIPTIDPVEAIQRVEKPLKDCEVRVLLAYADREESKALAKRFPMFNVVVTADGGPQPPKESVVIDGTKTYLVEVGEKGESAIVLGIYRDREMPVRYQRVTLDSRFPASEKIHRLMSAYQEQLKMLGLEGLNIKPVPCPEARTKGEYVGSKACETCHEQSYDIWRKSKHAKAWKTLLETDPPRNHDPECISCHVIGWDPQRYYPFEGGFLSSKKTPELENVGCESCHGPGGAHVEAEKGSDMELQERLQKAMIVTLEESRSNPQKMCYNCHDLDNSPEFDFDKYWPEVKHYETESGEKEEDDE